MKLLEEMPLKVAKYEIAADIHLLHNQFKKINVICFWLCLLVATGNEKTLISLQNSYFLCNLT